MKYRIVYKITLNTGKVISDNKPFLILVCGGKESSDSLRSINAQIQALPLQNIESRFLSRNVFQEVDDLTLDETLAQYANESDKYQQTVIIMLKGSIGEGLMALVSFLIKAHFV